MTPSRPGLAGMIERVRGLMESAPWPAGVILAEAVTALEAQDAEIRKLREALEPFAQFAVNTDDAGHWLSNIHRESISTWFGPSAFRDAATAHFDSLPGHPIHRGHPMTAAETIVAAALCVQLPEVTPDIENAAMVFSKAAPARHHHLVHEVAALVGRPISPSEQGFITSTGRYVGRVEAMCIAEAAGQVKSDHVQLFSEDLW